MKVKRMKHHRKYVRFYTTCFGFREPYKVFCDGTFIHHLVTNQITDFSQAISNILGKPAKLFTTRCVIAELHSLGESFSKSFEEARNLSLARCDHEKRKGAAACIADVIGEKNSEHFFLATQDNELRIRFREVPGVPLIFGLRKSLILEPPSTSQREFVKSSEEQRLRMTEMEKTLLKRGISKIATEDGDPTSDAHEEASGNEVVPDAFISVPRKTDGPQFKRNKPKGPNPLSCKKKKVAEKPSTAPNKDGDSAKRNRKRKRSRRGTKSEGADA
ncbi:hypothetical protein C5167_024255 [Papaver somniferum]|uniref:UTP23 sensor motif region domain-containing protein n=1 Tax=Papaver somniferum TaxID=3469 RepID=A0A4Y7JR16_PAPSO|nr:rRNA-processing protein UTP23 homolog [Papaver somniferum]RZC62500.1 hypothetical protein C5167_024255 [Papaver somniferum]